MSFTHPTLLCQVRTKQLDIAGAEEQVAKLEGLLKEAKAATDKVQKEYNALSEKVNSRSVEAYSTCLASLYKLWQGMMRFTQEPPFWPILLTGRKAVQNAQPVILYIQCRCPSCTMTLRRLSTQTLSFWQRAVPSRLSCVAGKRSLQHCELKWAK